MKAEEVGVKPLVSGQKFITFKLPTPPPSMNSMYNVMFSMRRVEMKPEVRQYKTMMKMYVPAFDVDELDRVKFEIVVSKDWYCKNESMKKEDVQNMAKLLIDLISEKQGWDDKHVWEFKIEKAHDTNLTGVFVKEWVL